MFGSGMRPVRMERPNFTGLRENGREQKDGHDATGRNQTGRSGVPRDGGRRDRKRRRLSSRKHYGEAMRSQIHFPLWILLLAAMPRMTQGQTTYALRPDPAFNHVRTSDHFAVLWKDDLGVPFDAAAADSGLRELESMREFFLTKTRFPEYYSGAAEKYKTNILLSKDAWASGGGQNGHPFMSMHPEAFRDAWHLAASYVYSLQSGTGGFNGNPYVGWFNPGHANWMAHQYLPGRTDCAELYTRTANWFHGSTRNRFCNWQFLEYLKELESIGFIARLWTDGWPAPQSPEHQDEDFFRALMRLKQWNLSQLGDVWGAFALRMARYDFANGALYRKKWEQERPYWQLRLTRTPLDALDPARRRYAVPPYLAPQRYGYNIVRLRRESGQTRVRVVFQGVAQEANANPSFRPTRPNEPAAIPPPGSGWRFGLVAVDTVRTAFRYSPVRGEGEAALDLRPEESEVYLVVAATPTNRQLIRWEQPYYTIYRYPWMCEVHGAWPDGFQPGKPLGPSGVPGAPHPNGGGFVAATAVVAATAYVGPQAMVLGTARVQGKARVEGRAIVGGGEVRDQAVIADDAGVWAGQVYGNARVDEAAQVTQAETHVYGTARLGGQAVDWEPSNLSGTVQMLGDAEIRAVTADHGVFYGYVAPAWVRSAELGADRTGPEPEVTRAGPYVWQEAGSVFPGRGAAKMKARPRRWNMVTDGALHAGPGIRDALGRRPGGLSPAKVTGSSTDPNPSTSALPGGVYFIAP
jgi:hypothetical protein